MQIEKLTVLLLAVFMIHMSITISSSLHLFQAKLVIVFLNNISRSIALLHSRYIHRNDTNCRMDGTIKFKFYCYNYELNCSSNDQSIESKIETVQDSNFIFIITSHVVDKMTTKLIQSFVLTHIETNHSVVNLPLTLFIVTALTAQHFLW